MKLSLLLPPKYDERKWTLARQIGVKHAITKAAQDLSGKPPPYDFNALKSIKEDFQKAGFELYGLEGDQFDMTAIKLGLYHRDELIDRYCQMLSNMGKLGIPLLCYNFMAAIGWYRTKTNVIERGGAITSEFDIKDIENRLVPEEQQISEEKLWSNLFYFLDAVLPVAEESGVTMALHPDDPPISPFMGIGRILINSQAFEKIWNTFPVPANKITYCQATFKAMGEDIKALSGKWIKEDRVAFIHLRDIEGDKFKFHETFHDNGPTPMAEMIKHYNDYGFSGPIRPDHAPAMYGEVQQDFSGGISVGYEITGKIFAVGHIKGVCEANNILLE